MKPARFRFVPGPVGAEEVVINGHDVTTQVQAVSLLVAAGHATQVRLQLVPGVGFEAIEGEGVVEVVTDGDADGTVAFLSNVDPALLEKELMERTTMADSPVVAMLDVLKEWASGAGPT